MPDAITDCMACRANRGELVAPGGAIYVDGLWQLEHSLNPAPLVGWLILKPLRHCEGFDALTEAEAAALGPLLRRACAALRAATRAEKVYVISMGESVAYLHIHLIPRRPEHPENLRGPGVFELLRRAVEDGVGVPETEAAALAADVRARLAPSASQAS